MHIAAEPAPQPVKRTRKMRGEKEWEALRELINQKQQKQKRDDLLTSFTEWRLAVKEFRKVEMKRIVLGEPNEHDFGWQQICLIALLAMGEAILLWSRAVQSGPGTLKISDGDLKACVWELWQSIRELRHECTEEEIEATKRLIFGGAP